MTTTAPATATTSTPTVGAPALWRPYDDEPLFVPEMLLGLDALEGPDAARLTRYLAALVTRRGVVHTNVAFNALYFGYDLDYGGYVGGPVNFDEFPHVTIGETVDAVPVGAMLTVTTGSDPLHAEVTYKEGAHPDMGEDGYVPGWLSGAPAGARGPGQDADPDSQPQLNERLVVDFDAFGPNLVATPAKLDRLRHRRRWLDANGHVRLSARYPDAAAAEASDREYYAQYLLTRGRDQLLAGPLPLLLTADAEEDQLAAALRAALATVAEALAAVPALRTWGEYAFARSALATRLTADGPLCGHDLATLAAAAARATPTRRRHGTPEHAVRYSAVGPLLHTITDSATHLTGAKYSAAVCHANAVFADYATGESNSDGVLPSGAHLRLDDAWQGGGVWRASNPPGPYATLDPRVPYGLGWLDSQPDRPAPARTPDDPHSPDEELPAAAEDDFDGHPVLLSATDSHLSWTITLRLSHILDGVAVLPERVCDELIAAGMDNSGLRLALAHAGYDLLPDEVTQAVTVVRAGPLLRLASVTWPIEYFPGIVLTFTWQRGAIWLRATSTLLQDPVIIDGIDYEHRYDPSVLTRETAPGCSRPHQAAAGPLTLRERVLRAVRRIGLLDTEGAAALPADQLPDLVYGAQSGPAGAAALEPVVSALLAEGVLSQESAVRTGGLLRWPATGPGQDVTVLVWRPRATPATPRSRTPAPTTPEPEDDLTRYVTEYGVAPFLRRLRPGDKASEESRAAYRALLARFGRVGELPAGHTLVREHTRTR